MRWCAWCLSQREIWQTPCSETEARCLILSRLDTLQLKRDRLDGPLMTRMTFWLCKGREISRNNHRSRHMSCHRRRNNPFPVSSKGPLECHEAGGAPWVLETFWYILGISWCNLLCPHQSLSSTYVVWHFPCTLFAERWPSCRRLRYSSWSSPGMINLGPFRSIPSSVDRSSLKVPVSSRHSWYVSSLIRPALLCELIHRRKDGVSLGAVLQLLNPWLRKGNVVYWHIRFDFCCDIGQIDRFSIIELFPLSSCQMIILIARMTFNCFSSCLMS